MREIKLNAKYRHFKGKEYETLYVAKHSETQEDYVVYRQLYGNKGIWIRPLEMFLSKVDKIKYTDVTQEYRFEEID